MYVAMYTCIHACIAYLHFLFRFIMLLKLPISYAMKQCSKFLPMMPTPIVTGSEKTQLSGIFYILRNTSLNNQATLAR